MIKLQDKSVRDRFPKADISTWLATWGGSGFIKPAPGTWGSLTALPFAYGLLMLGVEYLFAGIIVVTTVGLWASSRFSAHAKEKDSSMIVIDEVAGQWIALLPASLFWLDFILCFVLFRLFDIVKPWPISWIDRRISGAAGVMADDLLAGLFAAIAFIGIQYGLG